MSLIRRNDAWDLFRDFEDMSRRFSHMLGRSRTPAGEEQDAFMRADWMPGCNISETEKDYRIGAELPGVKKDDVKVMLQDGVLTISGERREQKEEKNEKVHRQEVAYGSFVRRFTMPEDADESAVDASYKDGMLKIVIGKSKAKASKAREVSIG